jgi:hypothetical protein
MFLLLRRVRLFDAVVVESPLYLADAWTRRNQDHKIYTHVAIRALQQIHPATHRAAFLIPTKSAEAQKSQAVDPDVELTPPAT